MNAPKARPADPCCFVIFGASGDLAHRLLVPALYNLGAAGLLPKAFALIGVARSAFSTDAFRDGLKKSLAKFTTRPLDERVVKELLSCVTYVQGDPDDDETYKKLGMELTSVSGTRRATACFIWRRRPRLLRRSDAISDSLAWRAKIWRKRKRAAGGESSSRSRSAPTLRQPRRSIRSS